MLLPHPRRKQPLSRLPNPRHSAAMTVPDKVLTAARHSYFGHRFDLGKIGFFSEVHVYDLVGAYAWATTMLPCFAHGEWFNVAPQLPCEWGDSHRACVRLVSWDVPLSRTRPWGPFPWRYPDGGTCYPRRGAGRVWHPEYEAAIALWPPSCFTVHDAWSFVPGCDHRPWEELGELLEKRNEFPALKRMLNSIPGKLAQSRPRPGPYFDPIAAGLVTSIVRGRMLTALHAAGSHAIACVADALWTDAPVSLLSPGIVDGGKKGSMTSVNQTCDPPLDVQGSTNSPPGSWKHEAHDDTLVVQPGLSFGDPDPHPNLSFDPAVEWRCRYDTDDWHPYGHILAAQGTPALALQTLAPAFRQAWNLDGLAAGVEIPYDHFIGVAEGLASGLQIGTWTRQHHEVRFDPIRKRETWDAKATPAGASFHVSTLPPLAPDPDYLLMTGEEPPQVGKALMSSPYWDAEWNAVSPPMDDLWPTPSDELVE